MQNSSQEIPEYPEAKGEEIPAQARLKKIKKGEEERMGYKKKMSP